jgi:hypothetical protein
MKRLTILSVVLLTASLANGAMSLVVNGVESGSEITLAPSDTIWVGIVDDTGGGMQFGVIVDITEGCDTTGTWLGEWVMYCPPVPPPCYPPIWYPEYPCMWYLIDGSATTNLPGPGLQAEAEFKCLADGDAVIDLFASDLVTLLDTLTVHQVEPPPGDFDGDGGVDCDDLRILALAWMSISGGDNWNPVCDISEPSDGVIDGQDFVVFALDWAGCGDPLPEPGMSYNIEDCDLAKAAGPDKNGLRFSATVQSNHILFEDMIHANCCSDTLLEMTVEDDLITIYEIELLVTPCLCMCDFPVTATLGPFASGTYTLEVYEDRGGFIGSTVVIVP